MPVKLPTMGGGSNSTLSFINFPITISSTQPTAIRSGHIWINSSIGTSITSVVIKDGYDASISNGTLLLVANGLLRNETITDKVAIQGGNSVSITNTMAATTSKTWLVTSNTSDTQSLITYFSSYPFVYSKIGNVIDVETAYVWNGSSWLGLTQKGAYAFHGTSIKNINADNTYTNNLTLPSYEYVLSTSLDGTWVLTGSGTNAVSVSRYKRSGNVFTKIDSWDNSNTHAFSSYTSNRQAVIIDNAGTIIGVYQGKEPGSTNYYYMHVKTYDINKNQTISTAIDVGGASSSYSYYFYTMKLTVNEDNSRIAFSFVRKYSNSDSGYSQFLISCIKSNDTYVLNQKYEIKTSGYADAYNNCFLTGNVVYLVLNMKTSSYSNSWAAYVYKIECNTILNSRNVSTLYEETAMSESPSNYFANYNGLTSNKKYLITSTTTNGTLNIINLQTKTKTTVTLPSAGYLAQQFQFSLKDDVLYCSNGRNSTSGTSNTITSYAYNVADNGTTLSFTVRSTVGSVTYGHIQTCPRAYT